MTTSRVLFSVFLSCSLLGSESMADYHPVDADALWRDEANWSGSIYFSKRDPRFFVPKRVTWMGWTINFGHPKSTCALATLILLPSLILAGTLVGVAASSCKG